MATGSSQTLLRVSLGPSHCTNALVEYAIQILLEPVLILEEIRRRSGQMCPIKYLYNKPNSQFSIPNFHRNSATVQYLKMEQTRLRRPQIFQRAQSKWSAQYPRVSVLSMTILRALGFLFSFAFFARTYVCFIRKHTLIELFALWSNFHKK